MENGNILIVDDESSLRKVLSDLLRLRGYSPEPVATGREAIERVEQGKHAVAIVDLGLGEGDMSGIDVIKEIKLRSPGTECIVLTGNPSQQSAIEAVNMGVYSYMEKPFNVKKLLESIGAAFQKQERAPLTRLSADLSSVRGKNAITGTELEDIVIPALAKVADLVNVIGNAKELDEARNAATAIRTEVAKAWKCLRQITADKASA